MSPLLPEPGSGVGTAGAAGVLLAPDDVRTPTVLMDIRALDEFLAACTDEYLSCTPEEPPGCFAVLVGSSFGDIVHIDRLVLARNVRATDTIAGEEFSANIVPCFGAAYNNKRRGYWCDAQDLLRIDREADRDGLEIVGSIHLHPDWHRIGPAHERGLRISEHCTPMDRHMFVNTGWPINIICYLEGRDGLVVPTLAAWGSPNPGAVTGAVGGQAGRPAADACPALPIRLRNSAGELLEGGSLPLPPIAAAPEKVK